MLSGFGQHFPSALPGVEKCFKRKKIKEGHQEKPSRGTFNKKPHTAPFFTVLSHFFLDVEVSCL
jgi:hypothetical protein